MYSVQGKTQSHATSNLTPGMCAGENLTSEKLSFGSVHTYLVDRCGENIDCGEKKIEIG